MNWLWKTALGNRAARAMERSSARVAVGGDGCSEGGLVGGGAAEGFVEGDGG